MFISAIVDHFKYVFAVAQNKKYFFAIFKLKVNLVLTALQQNLPKKLENLENVFLVSKQDQFPQKVFNNVIQGCSP